jgi:signal transduction histidine kinase/DNA-binding response OmpR family regulator
MNAKFLKSGVFLFYLILPGIFFGFPPTQQSSGFKYFKNYSPQDYNNQPQNWAVLQDKQGIIYMANQGGLMEFDGVSWKMLLVPNRVVRSMVMDDTSPKGTIYIGGKNEIGFTTPDNTGKLQYVSLRDRLPRDTPNFADVFAAYRVSKKIYFQSAKFLFRWDPSTGQMKVFENEATGTNSFVCGGKFYIYQANTGLSTIENDSIKPLPGITKFDSSVCMICPYNAGKILIGTVSNGLFLYNGAATVPFPTGADELLKQNRLYTGLRLSAAPGQFALGTSGNGLVILDSRGNVTYTFDKSTGLPVDSILDIFEDPGGNLWLSLETGLSKIEYASPLYIYDARNELGGIALSLMKYNDVLFAGTTDGLFYLTTPGKFRPVPGINKNFECWSLISTSDSLLAGLSDGTYRVEVQNNGRSIKARKVMDRFTYVLYPSRVDPNRVWAGSRGELISLYRVNKTSPWKTGNITPIKGQEIKSMVEDKKGRLWLGTVSDGVLRFDFSAGNQLLNQIHFTQTHGLPPGGVYVVFAAGHVLFLTHTGLARFDEKENRFYPDNTLGNDFSMSGTKPVFRLIEDTYRNTWFHSKSLNYHALLKPDGTYDIISRPFLRIPLYQVNCIYFDPGENCAWFASINGLIRYDLDTKTNTNPIFNTLIREVELINGKIPVLNGHREDQNPGQSLLEFEYKNRNIRFKFAAPFFEDEKRTAYAYRLEGYDDDWAPFSTETQKDYTNLGPGTYTFRARAINLYGDLSKEALYRFKILPPWYQTWWAFLIYGAIALLILYLVVKWRSRRLVQEKQKLEQIIKERTEEINRQKLQLLEQAEKLKEMDKVKSRFFANISHEFRTPLTLILGPLEQMLTTPREKESEQKKKMRMMLRNSRRLLGLINQLLELSKFDSGTMKLQAARQNVVPFLKGIFYSFDSLAVQKEIELIFQTEAEDITLYYDPGKLEEVISNLVSNAVKFTPSGGVITLAVKVIKASTDPGAAGEQDILEVSVSDTGPGIPREELGHIFDRFYQAESTYDHHRQGTGIGLAIAREIVELHHGTITAYSPVNEGSGARLVIRLSMGDSHLKPDPAARGASEGPSDHLVSRLIAAPNSSVSLDPSHHSAFIIHHSKNRPLIAEGISSTYNDVTEEIEPVEKEKETRLEPAPLEKDIILVVEDSADVREYIRGALEPHYAVKEAKDGVEGLRLANEIIPDLVICDIMMPGPDGYEVCRGLKNDIATSHIPVILLTAKAGEECIVAGLETGADDYITKPFSTKILCARIKNLIDLRRHLRETFKREMTLQPAKIKLSAIDEEFIKDLYRVLEKNMSDPEFNVEELSRKLYMNRVTLYRKINALTGDNPTEFIRSYRLKRGAEMLETTSKTVLEVAFEVGFSSSSYFIKCFKDKFHRLPTQYQRAEKMKEEGAS